MMAAHLQEHQKLRNGSLQDTRNGKLTDGRDHDDEDDDKGVVHIRSKWNTISLAVLVSQSYNAGPWGPPQRTCTEKSKLNNSSSTPPGLTRLLRKQRLLHLGCPWDLSLVCVLLGVSLIMMLDGCRSGSESWVLLGSAGVRVWDWSSVCVVLSFTVLQVALYYLPVGQVTEGKMGCDGKRLKYKLNGLHAFLLTVVLVLVLWFSGVLRAGSVTVRIFSLVTAGMTVSLAFSLMLFLCPIRTPSSAHVTYDNKAQALLRFVLGESMDPCLGIIDVKHFVMVRIGFIGWGVMDVNYLLSAVEMKTSSLSLLLVIIFQLVYILDFLIDEGSVLPTKEFTQEPIGFIMILGEFIWIPFFSSLPVYFLLQRPNHIHFLSAVCFCVLFTAGFLIYYLSNEQKDGFRRNPNDPAYARLKTIRSPAGVSLLVSGWFGWVRHPNYLGDVLMMFAWCLPCGFSSVLPFLPALQCFNLLRQRANEIEESCLKKHGDAWREYCRRVPYKLLPYVY